MYTKIKNKFVKHTLAGLMFLGLPHVPSGPISKDIKKEKILLLYELHCLIKNNAIQLSRKKYT